jgi:3-oxoacyl-[acyl-carrier protein] reductase
MDLGLTDRVAVVAASTRGLGLASAEALAAEGARVVVNGRDAQALTRFVTSHPDSVAVPGDLGDPTLPQRLVDTALEQWGRVDVVVGNNGGPPSARALDVTDEQVLRAVDSNLLSSTRLARAAIPHMRQAGWGRICFIASSSVRQPIGDLALSNVARTGLWAWAKTAAQDLADDGITVNLACPGQHATERLIGRESGGRVGDPADFGKVVAFLCSEPAAFVSGIAMGVDGAGVAGLL